MRKIISVFFLAILLTMLLGETPLLADATINISDDTRITLGGRLQVIFINTGSQLDTTSPDFENVSQFGVRRARIRLGAEITRWINTFLQTDIDMKGFGDVVDSAGNRTGETVTTSSKFGVKIVDATITINVDSWLKLIMGLQTAPSSRGVLTSSAALIAVDRPGLIGKNITWKMKSNSRFFNTTLSGTESTLTGFTPENRSANRDVGITAFGYGEIPNSKVSFKYYLGAYDGQNSAGSDNERITGRLQINLFDPEPEYKNFSTYLGDRKTLGFGASYDIQNNVGFADGTSVPSTTSVDYQYYSFDIFSEYPAPYGSVSVEAGYSNLDLAKGSPSTEGEGYYIQAGYLINQWQPWAEYESWNAKASGNQGDYTLYRIGLSYFIKGESANIKIGYETLDADYTIPGSNEHRINTFLVGFFTNY